MRRIVRSAAALAVGGSVAVTGVPGAAQEARTLTVTPATELVDGDVVTLHGTGFAPGYTVYFCQGIDDGGSPGPDKCGAPYQWVQADAAGEFDAAYTVQRFLVPSIDGSTVDCAQHAARCVVGASDYLSPAPGFAVAPITFTPQPARALTVAPDTDLVDGDVVTVHGTGFAPSATVSFCQTLGTSAPRPEDCGVPYQTAQTDAAGEFTAEYTVRRFMGSPDWPTDCAASGVGCFIGASDRPATPGFPMAPIAFVPQPPPTVTITPTEDLVDGEVLELRGSSFPPGSTVSFCQGREFSCLLSAGTVQVDATGVFTLDYAVQRFLPTAAFSWADCAAPPADCWIEHYAGGTSAKVPIAFAPQPLPPQLTGTVSDSDGAPVAGADVWAYAPSDTWVGSLQTVTDAAGAFAIPRLEPGVEYRILIRPATGSPLAASWWDSVSSRLYARPVALSAVEFTEMFPQLTAAGAVSGTVTDAGGTPLGGVRVSAFGRGDTWVGSHSATTSSDGTYRIDGLWPENSGGPYRLLFTPPAGSGLAATWYDGAVHQRLATPVGVVGGQTLTGIDAQLAPAGAISGSVTDADGNPLPGLVVSAFGPADTVVASHATTTAADGSYRIGGIGAAAYRVRFLAPAGSGLVTEWFDDAPHRAEATPVDVAPGQTAAGVDAQLAGPP